MSQRKRNRNHRHSSQQSYDREIFFRAQKARLPNYIHNKHIREHFAEFETDIVSVVIARDQTTKQSKGFGFIKFTSHQVAINAQKKLHGSMLQGKFCLYLDMRKPPGSTSESASATRDDSRAHSKVFQLQPVAMAIEGLHPSLKAICVQNNATCIFDIGSNVTISGYNLEDIEQSWKEVEAFVEQNVPTTTSIQVSYGCAKFLQVKNLFYLEELRKQCKVLIPPSSISGENPVTITLQGTKGNTDDVFEKLTKLSSNCHVELFQMQCPNKLAKSWKIRWDRFRITENAKHPNIMISFTITQVSGMKGGKNTVTVLIVGTDQAVVQDLKGKVLKNENSSHMTVQRLKLSKEEFEAASSNLKQLETKLEQELFTVISLEYHTKIIELQTPSSLEIIYMEAAKGEVTKFTGMLSSEQSQTIVTQYCFDDVVVGMMLTTKPQYCEEIRKDASQRSVIVHIQAKPKPGFQLRGNRKDIEAIKQKISSLNRAAERGIDQTQMVLDTTSYHLLSTDVFSKYQEELLNKKCVRVSYPPRQGLLRQQLLRTSIGHMITLQLCKGQIATECVDAIIIDLNQTDLSDPVFQQKFMEYVEKNGTPKIGSATCYESSSLSCQNVIVAPCLKWKGDPGTSTDLLFSPYKESLSCSISKGFGTISFMFSGNTTSASTIFLVYALDDFCATHFKMSIHTIRIVLDYETAGLTTMFDKKVSEMKHLTVESSHVEHLNTSSSLHWLWRDDRKQFIPYPSDISAKLTKAKKSNPNGSCFFAAANENHYTVDFSTMKQKNFVTGFTRDVQCTASSSLSGELHLDSDTNQSSPNIQWYYMDDQNVLTQYTTEASDLIEKMYNGLSKDEATNSLVIKKRRYIFDFKRMKQTNSSTLRSRSIERRISALDRKKMEEKLVVTFRGPREHLPVAKRDVEKKVKELRYNTTVSLPHTLSSELEQKLHTIIGKHTVDYRIKEDSMTKGSSPHKSCKVFEIEGPESAVHKAVTEIQAEIINFHSETPLAAGPAIEYPQEWQPQAKTTEVFELSMFSGERRRIASKLRESLPDVDIISVQRIQNKWLWEKYEQSKRRTGEKNAGIVNEKELFHGSRKSSAEKIYNSEEGFDMRFSSQGVWGQANYFAVDAKYSDMYAYKKPDGSKELLLAKVLTGDSIACPPNSSLRMPPEKPTLSLSDNNVELDQIRYDTVNGVTKNTQVFMTYSNDKAYPAYLIVYSNTPGLPLMPQATASAVKTVYVTPASQLPQKAGLSTHNPYTAAGLVSYKRIQSTLK